MKLKPICIDFETKGIQRRPQYPPIPVGFSIRSPGDRRARYYGWGHNSGNNCTEKEGRAVLQGAWRAQNPLLFHNAAFDVDVAQTHMGMGALPWERCHDTLYLLFLHDPHQQALSLKPSAERLLGMAPEERDAVRDWLEDQRIVRKKQKDWGAYICEAPGDLVGTYANGDVDRTLKLFEFLYKDIAARGMLEAYDRERRLMPILLENERQGMRIDMRLLNKELAIYRDAVEYADNWLRKRLKVKDLNVDSDKDLADALENTKIITDWVLTPSGQRSVAKKNMTVDMFNDKKVASVLGYRNRAQTCINTFMTTWLDMGSASGGYVYTNWNQVRQSRDANSNAGARTGRMSTNPNFQNIPKAFEEKGDGYVHPGFLEALPPLPLMRRYILPDKGQVFCHRDYNQQELRILGHFEDGKLLEEYNANPRMDIHDFVGGEIKNIYGLSLPRSAVKVLNFGMIYGMGLGKLAQGMNVSVDEAKKIKAAQLAAIPGLKGLNTDIKNSGKAGEAIRTWGGREYYCEEPLIIDGRKQTFEYKLLNYLIQGSAADCTKEAIIRYDEAKREGRFLVTVHDEINLSVPPKAVKAEMKILREVMQSVEFDVPMLSDGKTGKSWGDLVKFKETA